MRSRIYIAGPISKGDLRTNIDNGRKAGMKLLKAGYSVMVPHLTCFMGGDNPEHMPEGTKHGDWLASDLPWVACADAVLRLPGESVGADQEESLALALGIPVLHSLEDVLTAIPPEKECFPQPHPVSLRFKSILDEMWDMHRRKAKDYGTDKDPLANIRSSADIGIPAWKGAYLRLRDKIKRIDAYCQNGTLANEGVEDSMIDLACYAVICLVLFREVNHA